MTEAMISPHMLRWAYERSGESAESAAQKMGVSPETLRSWELDNAKPSFSKAFEFAHKFNVPLGYLYLSKPPDEDFPLPDLRTVAGAHPRKPSPDSFVERPVRDGPWSARVSGREAPRAVGC